MKLELKVEKSSRPFALRAPVTVTSEGEELRRKFRDQGPGQDDENENG